MGVYNTILNFFHDLTLLKLNDLDIYKFLNNFNYFRPFFSIFLIEKKMKKNYFSLIFFYFSNTFREPNIIKKFRVRLSGCLVNQLNNLK